MTIRSLVVVGLLVVVSGALAVAQAGRVPGIPVDSLVQQPAKTVLITVPVLTGGSTRINCHMVNIGKQPIATVKNTIRLFDEFGEVAPGEDSNSCGALLKPGQICEKATAFEGFGHVYCVVSFAGSSESVRAAMQMTEVIGEQFFPGAVVEAR